MAECYNMACPYCVDFKCRRTCTCDMRLDGEYVKVVRCKDCKSFELDSWAEVNGNPLIIAHEVCTAWGRGCKTDPNGFCFMGERRQDDAKE